MMCFLFGHKWESFGEVKSGLNTIGLQKCSRGGKYWCCMARNWFFVEGSSQWTAKVKV